ncbi:hypothetical protein O3Q51_15960 [Cryomorphaceae bacterium 1068]|nr:hypothetical protein [Cryomorphaceae bacterium 1068]
MNLILFRFKIITFSLMIFVHILMALLLTVITQIGGLLYLMIVLVFRKTKWGKRLLVFIGLYALATFVIVPILAPHFGREKVKVEVVNAGYILANRNYVTAEMNKTLESIEQNLKSQYPELKLVVLDANFPFLDGFPLLPHLSHDDGKKVDLAFVYEEPNGQLTNQKVSRSGYGVFVSPEEGELNQADLCTRKGSWQYGITEYFSFGEIHSNLIFSEVANRKLLEAIIAEDRIGKVFVEPHLKERLGVVSDKIRFQGCHSVRHDDHFHIELR